MDKIIGIYKITSPTGKIYIGQSINIFFRFKQYQKLKCKDQTRLYNSFMKHGVENHVFNIVCECKGIDLNKLERYYQEKYEVIKSKGLNCRLTNTNDKTGECSKETKIKISNSLKGVPGSRHSPESKMKISVSKLGNTNRLGSKMSDNHKKIMLKVNSNNKYSLGRVVSKEIRENLSKQMQGNTHCVGRIMSMETREKISKNNRGRKLTEESKNKISLSRKKIILDNENGIFYIGIKEASEALCIEYTNLGRQLNGRLKNTTSLIYV